MSTVSQNSSVCLLPELWNILRNCLSKITICWKDERLWLNRVGQFWLLAISLHCKVQLRFLMQVSAFKPLLTRVYKQTAGTIIVFFFTNLMHKSFIWIHLLYSSTCFEHYYAHLQEDNCINMHLVSSLSLGDDTRSCVNTFVLLKMSTIVLETCRDM